MKSCDLLVIGAGPAGVSATLYARARGAETLVADGAGVGGLIGRVSTVSHFLGLKERISGPEFAALLTRQLEESGAAFLRQNVTALEPLDEGWRAQFEDGETTQARAVILALGSRPKVPEAAGLEGKPFAHFALELGDVAGKACLVLGGGDGAAKESLYLLERGAKSVHLIFPEEKLPAIAQFAAPLQADSRVVLHPGCTLVSLEGGANLQAARLGGREEGDVLRCAEGMELLICAGQTPNDGLLRSLGLAAGFVEADARRPVLPRLWVAGDLRAKKVRQVVTAADDGTMAAIAAWGQLAVGRTLWD